jgi:P27 family predicted phage terminase small subunit
MQHISFQQAKQIMSSEGRLNMMPRVDDDAAASAQALGASIVSEVPDMPAKLSTKEKKVWQHITQALLEYGLIHRTDGMMLVVICRTFCDWLNATEELDKFKEGNGGSYMTESKNGYVSAHPLYHISTKLKKDLLLWLPEAALTITSFHKIKGDQIEDKQGTLFDDPIEKFRQQKTAIGMRAVK